MVRDPHADGRGPPPEWDDLVVGSGPLGAIVARRLAEGGRRVAIVERGRAVTAPPGSHLRNTPSAQADPDGYFPRALGLVDMLDEGAPEGGLPGAFTTSVVGGSGILWTNNRPRAVAGVDRPEALDPAEWDRCYAIAEACLRVRPDEFEDSRRGRAIRERLAGDPALAGREVVALPLSGRRTAPDRIRYVAPHDVLDGGPRVARLAGTVGAVAHDAGRVRGVRVDGATVSAANVVLAAGAIDTPVILWRSGVRPDALGRHLSYHEVLFAQVVLADGLGGTGTREDPLPRLGVLPSAERPWFTMILRDTCPLTPSAPDADLPADRLVELQAFAPVDPAPRHRMLLGEDGAVAFDVRLGAEDRARMDAIERDVRALGAAIGRFRAGCEPGWLPAGSPHLIGSCRMGADPSDSVADDTGRVHGFANLYLATNGLIPTRLAVNPTLTAAALAVRTADRILARASRGRLLGGG